MPEQYYHIKVKKEYAAALIDDLIKVDALENMESSQLTELPQWQKDALDKELQTIADNPDYLIPWDNVKGRFKQI
jgi:hypothetical protein